MAANGKSFFLYTGYLRTFPGITELSQLVCIQFVRSNEK